MPDKILITGGAGFIGCRVAARFLAQGHEVAVFDNLHPQVHSAPGWPSDLPAGAMRIPGDVTVAENWATLFRFYRPEVIVHLAAETGTGQSLTHAHRHVSVNVDGTAQMLDALHASQTVPRNFVLTSSRAVYGDGAWQEEEGTVFYPSGRSHEMLERKEWDFLGRNGKAARALPHRAGMTSPNPINVYGATKLAQEHVLSAWCRAFGSRLAVLRLQNVFGPGQSLSNPYTGVLTWFGQAALRNEAIDVYEDGQIVRDFVFVDDVCSAIVAAAAYQSKELVSLFDIGSGQPTTILEVARALATMTGAPPPRVSGKFRDGDVRAASCEIEAAAQALHYAPKQTLQQALTALMDWMRKNVQARAR